MVSSKAIEGMSYCQVNSHRGYVIMVRSIAIEGISYGQVNSNRGYVIWSCQ